MIRILYNMFELYYLLTVKDLKKKQNYILTNFNKN